MCFNLLYLLFSNPPTTPPSPRLQVPEVDFWVIPIIQGFVQVEELVVNYNDTSDEDRSSPETPLQEVTCVDDIYPRFTVALISRRSRHRAGTVVSTLHESTGMSRLNKHGDYLSRLNHYVKGCVDWLSFFLFFIFLQVASDL